MERFNQIAFYGFKNSYKDCFFYKIKQLENYFELRKGIIEISRSYNRWNIFVVLYRSIKKKIKKSFQSLILSVLIEQKTFLYYHDNIDYEERIGLLIGAIQDDYFDFDKIEKMIKSKPDEICPEKYEEYHKKKIDLDNFIGRSSELYKCPKCKQRNASVMEKQIRASDEASSIFCKCINCGKFWQES